jgi:hypothetical protein
MHHAKAEEMNPTLPVCPFLEDLCGRSSERLRAASSGSVAARLLLLPVEQNADRPTHIAERAMIPEFGIAW